MAEDLIHNEFLYYLAHQDEFVDKYNGKVIVLFNHEVFGAYTTYGEAHVEARKNLIPGTYILQLCSPGPDAYTIHAHTRYSFH